MDYKVVFGRDADELEKKVQNLADLGWIPCGGIAFSPHSAEAYQAMTSTTQSRVAARKNSDYAQLNAAGKPPAGSA